MTRNDILEILIRDRSSAGRALARLLTAYRQRPEVIVLDGQQVILVDDGLATGATMQAAIKAVRQQSPARIVVAVPVAPPDSVALLRRQVDELICPFTPKMFTAIGRWYVDFSQASDQQVQALLRQAWQREQDEQDEQGQQP